jgi:hypothetical protein
MSNDEIDHGNGFFSQSFPPPLTDTKFYSDLDDYAQKICRGPVSLPDGYQTVQVSERYRIPWAAEPEDRTREAIVKVRKMTEEDMEHFKEDLEKSAVDWIEAQKGEATGGENDIMVSENNTGVATEGGETGGARSRRMRKDKRRARRESRLSRRAQKLSMRKKSLDSREQILSVREKSLFDEEQRLIRREGTLGRGENELKEARLRFQEESREQGHQTDWTGTSSFQGEDQQISSRQRRSDRSMRGIYVSVPGSSRGRVSSITVKFG